MAAFTATASLYLDIWAHKTMHVSTIETCGEEGDMRVQVCSCGWRSIPVPAAYDDALEPCAVLDALTQRAERRALARNVAV